jgi:Cell Wall Hydrolase
MPARISSLLAEFFWLFAFIGIPALVAHFDSLALERGASHSPASLNRNGAPAPLVEPLEVRKLLPASARTINAAIPFSNEPVSPARPFHYVGTNTDHSRAIACLAAAQIYEAGDDPEGQRAVAQVVINRLRHPAYPKTLCGVVFQGSERTTGCQFSFTCDGAMRRIPSALAWERARGIAIDMLNGATFSRVGYATHYHTDWVVPYWSAELDKIAQVHTHLFFRWKGYWGMPAAFATPGASTEPNIGALAKLDANHQAGSSTPSGGLLDSTGAVGGTAEALARSSELFDTAKAPSLSRLPRYVRLIASSSNETAYILELSQTIDAESYGDIARTFCSGHVRCRIMAWRSGTRTPSGFPIQPDVLSDMIFSYIHDADSGLQRLLWNCKSGPAPSGTRCMRERVPLSSLLAPSPVNAGQTSPAAKP